MRHVFVCAVLLLASASSRASETITYQYDALGRLVQVARTGTVNNGASATYTYDPANNRTNVTTTAPTGGGGMAAGQPPSAKDQPSQSSEAGNAAPRR
jgi:YD repeat-containing protein